MGYAQPQLGNSIPTMNVWGTDIVSYTSSVQCNIFRPKLPLVFFLPSEAWASNCIVCVFMIECPCQEIIHVRFRIHSYDTNYSASPFRLYLISFPKMAPSFDVTPAMMYSPAMTLPSAGGIAPVQQGVMPPPGLAFGPVCAQDVVERSRAARAHHLRR